MAGRAGCAYGACVALYALRTSVALYASRAGCAHGACVALYALRTSVALYAIGAGGRDCAGWALRSRRSRNTRWTRRPDRAYKCIQRENITHTRFIHLIHIEVQRYHRNDTITVSNSKTVWHSADLEICQRRIRIIDVLNDSAIAAYGSHGCAR